MEALYYDEGRCTADRWAASDFESIRHRIETILPLSESWNGSLLRWGDDKTDDVELIYEDAQIKSVSVRFDMRRPNGLLFGHVVSAAEDLRLALLDVASRRIIPRNVNALMQAAAASRAARFVAGGKG